MFEPDVAFGTRNFGNEDRTLVVAGGEPAETQARQNKGRGVDGHLGERDRWDKLCRSMVQRDRAGDQPLSRKAREAVLWTEVPVVSRSSRRARAPQNLGSQGSVRPVHALRSRATPKIWDRIAVEFLTESCPMVRFTDASPPGSAWSPLRAEDHPTKYHQELLHEGRVGGQNTARGTTLRKEEAGGSRRPAEAAPYANEREPDVVLGHRPPVDPLLPLGYVDAAHRWSSGTLPGMRLCLYVEWVG